MRLAHGKVLTFKMLFNEKWKKYIKWDIKVTFFSLCKIHAKSVYYINKSIRTSLSITDSTPKIKSYKNDAIVQTNTLFSFVGMQRIKGQLTYPIEQGYGRGDIW